MYKNIFSNPLRSNLLGRGIKTKSTLSNYFNYNNDFRKNISLTQNQQMFIRFSPIVIRMNPKYIQYLRYYSNRCLADLIKFTPEESNKILEVVNTKSLQQLVSYDISKNRLAKINTWRNKNGEFKSLEEILQIEGFGIKILDKFAKSILDEDLNKVVKKNSVRQKSLQFTIPVVSTKFKLNCKSCLSIHIGVSSITISRIEINSNGPCNLTDWKHFDLLDKKLHIHDLVERFITLEMEIPIADCYILENPQVATPGAPGTPDQVNINIQKAQAQALISYALAKRKFQQNNNELNEYKLNSNVFYLKRFLASRLFNSLVGTEKVSTEQAILDLLRVHYNIEDSTEEIDNQLLNNKFRGEILVSQDLRNYYAISEGYQKEFLGQSLLIGLTFIRLSILQCEKSFSKILGISNNL